MNTLKTIFFQQTQILFLKGIKYQALLDPLSPSWKGSGRASGVTIPPFTEQL